MGDPLKILFKYPSRSRPERFFSSLDSIVNNMQDMENFHVSCTLDEDDEEMHRMEVMQLIAKYPNTSVAWGRSISKIDAVNRDMPKKDWDIVVVMSDDMKITFYGFDTLLRNFVAQWIPDMDGLIHVPDPDAKQALATMYIATRKYYERFGYVYHPSYKSVWCDNEVQSIAKITGKYYYFDCPGLIMHLNPAYGHLPKDPMFIKQQAHWEEDEANYRKRKAKNFFL